MKLRDCDVALKLGLRYSFTVLNEINFGGAGSRDLVHD